VEVEELNLQLLEFVFIVSVSCACGFLFYCIFFSRVFIAFVVSDVLF